MPEIETNAVLIGVVAALLPTLIAAYRRKFILAGIALVVCVIAGIYGQFVFAIPMAINFLVTALVLPAKPKPGEEPSASGDYRKSPARFAFLLPGIFWILTFTLFPLFYSLYLSFTNANMRNFAQGNFDLIGFENYAEIFSDGRVGETIVTSVFLSLGSLALTLVLGTLIAWLFSNEMPGLRFFRGVMTMPLFAAPIALGYLGLVIFNETSGPLNYAIRGILGPEAGVNWFIAPWPARWAVLLTDTWQWTPFVFIIILAAMQSIPSELYEAARLDTASTWTLFTRITLPLIAPAMGTVALLRLVETFKILDIPLALTGGGPGSATQTYSYYIFINGLKNFNMGYASALAYVLVIIAIIVTSIYFWRVRDRFEIR